jgi:caa(3)-type oxidase subunit IV
MSDQRDVGTTEDHEAVAQMEDELAHHPGPRKYVFIGVVLFIVTAIEVAIFYLEIPDAVLITSLIVLSIVKFTMVVAWFMHLRFDSKLFRRLFATGLITAFLVFGVVLTIFFLANDGPAPLITGG